MYTWSSWNPRALSKELDCARIFSYCLHCFCHWISWAVQLVDGALWKTSWKKSNLTGGGLLIALSKFCFISICQCFKGKIADTNCRPSDVIKFISKLIWSNWYDKIYRIKQIWSCWYDLNHTYINWGSLLPWSQSWMTLRRVIKYDQNLSIWSNWYDLINLYKLSSVTLQNPVNRPRLRLDFWPLMKQNFC